jgi:hypothetical protein
MARTPGVSGDVVTQNLIINGSSVGNQSAIMTDSTVGSWTLSVADLVPGSSETYLILNGAQVGGVNAQLPLAAALVAALPFNSVPPQGATWDLRVINRASGQIITITTNTGWTLTGTMTLANNSWRDFVVSVSPLGACTLTAVGTGTDS